MQPDNEAPPQKTPSPLLHIVLFQPEIPQNTGNIGRTCVALQAKLWIVRPTPFRIDEKRVRRAGLDYWPHLDLELVDSWSELQTRLANHRFWLITKFGNKTYWDADFQERDVFVFGRETTGLPESIRNSYPDSQLSIPMPGQVRSLNLANSVAIVMFEAARQFSRDCRHFKFSAPARPEP